MPDRPELPPAARRLLAALARFGVDLRPALLRTRDMLLRPVREELGAASAGWREALRSEMDAQRREVGDLVSSLQEALLAETGGIRSEALEKDAAGRAQRSELRAEVARCLAEGDALRAGLDVHLGRIEATEAAQRGAAARSDERLTELLSRLEAERSERRSRMETLESLLTGPGVSLQPALDRLLRTLASPVVSVILPTRDRAHVIADAIASVQAQRFTDWELIVVDDGSTDQTAATVAPYLADARIRFVAIPAGGAGRARNHGLSLARGSLIAYLDSDNVWYPDFLAAAVNAFAATPAVDILYGALVTDAHGLDGTRLLWRPFDRERLLESNFIDINVVVHRKSLVGRYGGLDESLVRLADWDLVLRYTEHAPAHPLPVLAARYRACDGIRLTDTRPVGPSHAAVLRKWYPASGARRPLRVLYVLRRTAPGSPPVSAEIGCMSRWGVRVEVWRHTPSRMSTADFPPTHDGSLAEAVQRFRPDLIHVHGLQLAARLRTQLDELRLPVTIRADGLERRPGEGLSLLQSPWARRIYLLPHQRAALGPENSRLRSIPAAFDAESIRPARRKDRRLVLAAAGPSPRRDVRFLFDLAKRLPDHRCVLAAEQCGAGRRYGEGLGRICRSMSSPAEVRADLERPGFLALVADAGIYLETASPGGADGGAPVGTLSGLAEAMATGCHILVPDVPGFRELRGNAGTAYRSAAHAAELVAATARWTEEAWSQAEIASVDRAFIMNADELALRPIFEDWCAIAPAGPLPG